ncbi:hypothetical protein BDR04DRAFT_1037070, partial [Suillus decipiens]
VSEDSYRWRLRRFFTELFNHCFPINFRIKPREKLNAAIKMIRQLENLWNMIGNVAERQRVTRLWTGLNPSIQTELWKKELKHESSSFREV